MNVLVFQSHELDGEGRLVLPAGDRRLHHICAVLKVACGDTVRGGRLNGSRMQLRLLGEPDIRRPLCLVQEEVEEMPPWSPPRRVVLLAMPRPPALRRILQLLPQLGVERLMLTGAARVEKSYFHTPLLADGGWRDQLLLGLEQSCQTRLPEIRLEPRFHLCLEALEDWAPAGAARLLPHPGSAVAVADLPPLPGGGWCLALGAEGGWLETEARALGARGFQPVDLGPRILKVEAALERLAAQLDLLEELGRRERKG
jgi:RsmE family RNA methyltransferase